MLYYNKNETETNLTLVALGVKENVTKNDSTTGAPGEDCFNHYSDFQVTIFYIQFYLFAVVILSGLVLNVMAFVCFMTSQTLRKTTTGHYLIALTVADFTFLVGDFIRWLNAETVLGVKFYDEYNFWCKTIYFLRYFGKLVSAWVTVAITIERFVSVVYPLKASQLSTKRKTHIVISAIFLSCCLLTVFPFWTIGLLNDGDYTCVYCALLNHDQYELWNWAINRVGSLFIPSVTIFCFTTILLLKLHRVRRRRCEITRQQSSSTNSLETQLTVMLIFVAVAFLLLRLPYTIMFYLHNYWPRSAKDVRQRLWAARKLTDVLATSNYSINFFLYCLAGSSFRNQFISLVCCCRQTVDKTYTKTSSSPYHTTVTAVHSRKRGSLSKSKSLRVKLKV